MNDTRVWLIPSMYSSSCCASAYRVLKKKYTNSVNVHIIITPRFVFVSIPIALHARNEFEIVQERSPNTNFCLCIFFAVKSCCCFFRCRKLFSHLTAAPCLCNLLTDFIVDQCNVSHYSAWPHFSMNVFRLCANLSNDLFNVRITDVSIC